MINQANSHPTTHLRATAWVRAFKAAALCLLGPGKAVSVCGLGLDHVVARSFVDRWCELIMNRFTTHKIVILLVPQATSWDSCALFEGYALARLAAFKWAQVQCVGFALRS